jgi:hypothetical protein
VVHLVLEKKTAQEMRRKLNLGIVLSTSSIEGDWLEPKLKWTPTPTEYVSKERVVLSVSVINSSTCY